MKKSKKIYLDNASATQIDPSVFSCMQKVLKNNFANCSVINDLGIENKKILEDSRKSIANILHSHSSEVVFTSGSTESNNLAVLGVVNQYLDFFCRCALPRVLGGTLAHKKNQDTDSRFIPHIITTNIEHSSVLEVFKYLESTGNAEVTFVKVEANGIVDSKKIKKAIKKNTILVSVMYANNEIGTIQPIKEIVKEIRHYKKFSKNKELPYFHTDATQAINYLNINVEQLGVDMMSFNAGKIYGPKGIGALYKKRGIKINNILHGGDQERGSRPGTENLSSVVGFAKALENTKKIKEKENKRLIKLRDYFFKKLSKFDFQINGDLEKRLPNNINISVPNIPSDLLVVEFSAKGIYISEKSACKTGDKRGSHVIDALGVKNKNSLRFSLGRYTTKEDIDDTIKVFSEILIKLKRWYN